MEQEKVWIQLKTQLSRSRYFDCKLSVQSRYNEVSETILQTLNEAEFDFMILRTQFGNLINCAEDFNISSQIVWYLMLRQTYIRNKKEFWMVVRKRPIRFSMLEYGLITGLDCSNNFPVIVDNMKFYQRHFNGMNEVFLDDVKARLVQISNEYADDVNLEKVKLACLFFVAGVLWPIRKKKNPPIDKKLMQLVEDLDNFNKYPWGTVAYKEVLRSLRKNMNEKENELIKSKKAKKCVKGASYNLSGFLQPLQILAYECIPGIASTFAKRKEGNDLKLPRMCRWETNKWNKKAAPTHVKVVAAANSSELDIVGILTPTDDELLSSYYINGEFIDPSPDTVVEKIVELMLQGKVIYCRQSHVDDGASSQPCPLRKSTVNDPSKIHDYVDLKSVIMETKEHIDSKLEKMESLIERMELHFSRRFSQLEEKLQIVMEHMRKSTGGLDHLPVQKTLKDHGVVELDKTFISPSHDSLDFVTPPPEKRQKIENPLQHTSLQEVLKDHGVIESDEAVISPSQYIPSLVPIQPNLG